jgi:spore germination cell wall hydrolase CwlJ-like protein
MRKSFRCLVILTSAVSLTALAVPSDPIRLLTDSQRLATTAESMNYSEKANAISAKSRITTDFFIDYLTKNADRSQVHKLNKISKEKTQNIGRISEYEYNLLCQLLAAEAENQPYEGKMAVVGVVLNRSEYGWPFEPGIEATIFQDGAFSCVSDGRFYDAWQYVSEEDKDAVTQELTERYYSEFLYFTAGDYGKYGTPAYPIGDHYFCTY